MAGRKDAARCSTRLAAAACAAVMSACGGAESDEKVVRYKPFFTGISGAVHKTPPVDERREGRSTAGGSGGFSEEATGLRPVIAGEEPESLVDPDSVPGRERGLVIRHPDGSRTLVLKSVRHLMSNIERALDDGDEALLLEQAVAATARDHFRQEGKEPTEIIAYMQKHRRDIALLFSRMPFAERTPTVISERTGRNQFRLRLTGQAKDGLKFDSLWVELERGNWKFVWAS